VDSIGMTPTVQLFVDSHIYATQKRRLLGRNLAAEFVQAKVPPDLYSAYSDAGPDLKMPRL
jgi:hypothetical protein